MAQPLEQLSHTQHVVCSTHTPVTKRKEVVVDWRAAVGACGLCDVLDDPSLCFDFEDDSLRSRGDVRGVPVANVATHHRRVAQPGQRERFGTARSQVRILPRRLFPLPGAVIGSPPASEAGHVMVRIHPRQPRARSQAAKAGACKAFISSVRLRSRTPHAW